MNIDIIANTEYNPDFIAGILERIKKTAAKIKNFIKPKNNQYELYYKLNSEFDEITLSLKEYEILFNEYKEFLAIKIKVLNIVYNNCRDSTFGFCDFAVKLLEMFNELLQSKIRLIKNFSNEELERYDEYYKMYKESQREIDKKFHLEIFKPINENISSQNVYNVMKDCKW